MNSAPASLTTVLSRGLPSVRATSMTLCHLVICPIHILWHSWSIKYVVWFYFLVRVWGCSFDLLHQWVWIIKTARFALWELAGLLFYSNFSVLFELLCASSQAHPYITSCFPFFKETKVICMQIMTFPCKKRLMVLFMGGGESPSSFKIIVQDFAVYPASDRISMFMRICILFDAPVLF